MTILLENRSTFLPLFHAVPLFRNNDNTMLFNWKKLIWDRTLSLTTEC
jgi:hypothetical protein